MASLPIHSNSSTTFATIDGEKCAKLHNEILEIGWEPFRNEEAGANGRGGCDDGNAEKVTQDERKKTWWEHHFGSIESDHPTATELEARLAPSLVRFLKLVRADLPGGGEESNFFYLVSRLSGPMCILDGLNGTHGYWNEPPFWTTRDRFFYLYENHRDGQSGGVVFDMKTMKLVIWEDEQSEHSLKEEDDLDHVTRNWGTLETMLTSFAEMIQQQRYKSFRKRPEVEVKHWPDVEFNTHFHFPWFTMDEDDPIVRLGLESWNGLLSAIERRLPAFAAPDPQSQHSGGYPTDAIETCGLHGIFIKKFLRQARIPTAFKFVAPGLRITAPDELSTQPFKDAQARYNWKFSPIGKQYPLLFLRADCIAVHPEGRNAVRNGFVLNPLYNGHPWSRCTELPAGLYLYPSMNIPRIDGCKLLLPFPVGSRFAIFGDKTHITDDRRYDGLYQAGHGYLGLGRDAEDYLRLDLLFRNWTKMIEDGHWEAGPEGVLGSIEKFKEADTEGSSHLYFIKRTW